MIKSTEVSDLNHSATGAAFEYYDNKHVSRWGPNFFIISYLVHWPIYFVFPFKRHFNPFPNSNAWVSYVDLAIKIGHGHPSIMVYINFVELLSLIFHAKFQNHRTSVLEKIFKGFCYL